MSALNRAWDINLFWAACYIVFCFFFPHSPTWWVSRRQLCEVGAVHIFKFFILFTVTWGYFFSKIVSLKATAIWTGAPVCLTARSWQNLICCCALYCIWVFSVFLPSVCCAVPGKEQFVSAGFWSAFKKCVCNREWFIMVLICSFILKGSFLFFFRSYASSGLLVSSVL